MKRWLGGFLAVVLMMVALAPLAAAESVCNHKYTGGKKSVRYTAVDSKVHQKVESVTAKVCKKCGDKVPASRTETVVDHRWSGSKCKDCKLAKGTYIFNRSVSVGSGGVRSVKFGYKDSDLTGNSSKLSKNLAKASGAMAMAAYDASAVKSLASQMGYAVLGQYNYDRMASRADNGFVAFTIAKKAIMVKGQQKDVVACFVRGTGQGGEWYGNFDIGTSGVHEGFYSAADDVIKQLKAVVSANPNSIVWITGHSRGAAVANIAAADLTRSLGSARVCAYTFACPNVSTAPTAAMKNIINFVYQGDFVGQVPLAAWGFGRNGRTVTLSTSAKNKKMASKFRSLWGQSFRGTYKKPAALTSIKNAAPSLAAYYAQTPGYKYSVAQVFDAVAAYLARDASSPSATAVGKMIEESALNGQDGIGQLMLNQDWLFYGHCPEMYLAWMISGAF